MYTCETAARVTVGATASTCVCSDPSVQGVCSDPSQVAAFACDEMDAFSGNSNRTRNSTRNNHRNSIVIVLGIVLEMF